MTHSISRRSVLRNLALAAGALVVGEGAIAADDARRPAKVAPAPAPVTPDDDMASALSYHERAARVDAREFPSFKPGQNCATCAQSQVAKGAAWRACSLLPGKLVSAEGWCQAYVKRA
jgi:hypothetical protein